MRQNNFVNIEQYISNLFRYSSDVSIEKHMFSTKKKEQILVVYCNGLIEYKILINSILPDIQKNYYVYGLKGVENINCSERITWDKRNENVDKILLEKIFNGNTAIFIEKTIYFFNTSNLPKRSPEESNTEVSLRGPRDAFVEDLNTNVALVRKRLKSNCLVSKSFTLGKRSRTQVRLVYIEDILNQKLINEITNRLNNIDIDNISNDNQLLALLGDSSYSLFPLMHTTSRPDGVVSALIRGRFAIFIDNVPNVLVAPSNLGLLFRTPEDEYTPYYYATFELLIRLVGLMLSIFLPGFFVALTAYHPDQIPFPLLATIASSGLGIPFNFVVEIFLILGLFELFREAGVRLPKAVGQTVAVVGGLIVGSAAIQAGLTTPTLLVVSSITVVSTFTLGNQALYGTVSIIRLFSILLSSVLGMFGFFISAFLFLSYLAQLESFGVPYLSPVSPFVKKDFLKSIVKYPVIKQNERPKILDTIDQDRQGDKKK